MYNESEIFMSDGVLVDLSAPAVPANFVGWFSHERIYLEWSPNQEIDVDYYSIYGGTEPNSTTLLLTTQDTTAEAFMTGFSDTSLYYIFMTATDIPGNQSDHTQQVTGIPQWYNRHQQSTLAMNVIDDQVGDVLELYQEDRSLVMTLPEGAISGQVYIQYPPASKQLTTADDITSEKRIVLSSADEISGEILVEWADVV